MTLHCRRVALISSLVIRQDPVQTPWLIDWWLLIQRYSLLSSRPTVLTCDSTRVTSFFIACFLISTEVVYLQRWHGWCHMKLLRSVLFTPYNHAACHFMQNHIHNVYACLAVTCHLHFWQNDRDLLRAAAVTWGWNRYRNKSQHKKFTLEKKILLLLLLGFEPVTF